METKSTVRFPPQARQLTTTNIFILQQRDGNNSFTRFAFNGVIELQIISFILRWSFFFDQALVITFCTVMLNTIK